MGLALGFLCFLHAFVRDNWGANAALLATALLGLNPSFIAHASLNTNDFGAIALFFFALVGTVKALPVSKAAAGP